MRIAFIGNCQVESFAVSARHMLDGAEISVFDYSQTYSRSEEARRRFVLGLHSTDLVFAQTATFSHTSEHDLRDVLGDRLVTIANFYFRGLFPDSCYVGTFAARLDTPSALHNVVVLDGFRRGLSQEAVCARLDGAGWDALGVADAWSSSVAEMRAREAGGVLDVPLGELMEEACRRYPAFLTMNHPSGRLITEYFSKVLDHVGLRYRRPAENTYPDALARHDMVPIHDFVAERHELPYRTRQSWKINALGGAVSREDYVGACYKAYAQQKPESLLVHSPTDLVASLRQSAFRHLVEDGGVETARDQMLSEAVRRSREGRLAISLAQMLRPLETAVAELQAVVAQPDPRDAAMEPRFQELADRLQRVEEAARLAEAAGRADVLASVARLRDRAENLHRLLRLAVGLAVTAVLLELGRLIFAR